MPGPCCRVPAAVNHQVGMSKTPPLSEKQANKRFSPLAGPNAPRTGISVTGVPTQKVTTSARTFQVVFRSTEGGAVETQPSHEGFDPRCRPAGTTPQPARSGLSPKTPGARMGFTRPSRATAQFRTSRPWSHDCVLVRLRPSRPRRSDPPS